MRGVTGFRWSLARRGAVCALVAGLAPALAGSAAFDLVPMDVPRPELDGLEAVASARAIPGPELGPPLYHW